MERVLRLPEALGAGDSEAAVTLLVDEGVLHMRAGGREDWIGTRETVFEHTPAGDDLREHAECIVQVFNEDPRNVQS